MSIREIFIASIVGLVCGVVVFGESLAGENKDVAGEKARYALAVAREVDFQLSQADSGGLWKSDKDYGNFRVIVLSFGADEVKDNVYAQWIQLGANPRVRATVGIDEINDRFTNVESVTFTGHSGDGAAFRLSVKPRGENEMKVINLVLREPGKVEVQR